MEGESDKMVYGYGSVECEESIRVDSTGISLLKGIGKMRRGDTLKLGSKEYVKNIERLSEMCGAMGIVLEIEEKKVEPSKRRERIKEGVRGRGRKVEKYKSKREDEVMKLYEVGMKSVSECCKELGGITRSYFHRKYREWSKR